MMEKSIVELEMEIRLLRHSLEMVNQLLERQFIPLEQVINDEKNPIILKSVHHSLDAAIHIIKAAS